jgi:hypothetical protein
VDALIALAYQLRARGLTALYGAACRRLGVLSVVHGVTVWTDGKELWWLINDEETRWPVTEPEGAADRLAGTDAP